MKSKLMLAASAVALFFLMTGTGLAQAPWWQQRDGDRWGNWGYQGNAQVPYDRGFRDGRDDREHGRGWHPRNNGKPYMDGYRAGYGSNVGGKHGRNDHDADDTYRNGPYRNGPYGNGPYNGPYNNGQYGNYPYGNGPNGNYDNTGRIAYNNGYKAGMDYGRADKSSGHSYRPTYSDMYKRGTNGYNSGMGSQTAYKHAFQDGYRVGYDRAYNGGGNYRR